MPSIKNQEQWVKEIDSYASDLAQLSAQEIKSSLMSPQALKDRLHEQFKETLRMSDLEKTLEGAVEVLNQEGADFPHPEYREYLFLEFQKAAERLQSEAENPRFDLIQTLQAKGDLSEGAMSLIHGIAQKKYLEKDFEASKKLFTFLSLINHNKFDYWQGLGVCLQELKDYDKAIQAYERAWAIRHEVSNRLFVAECYLKLKDLVNAQEVMDDLAHEGVESDHLTALRNCIKAAS